MEYNDIKSLLNEPETLAEGLAQLDIYVAALEQTNTDLTKSVEKYKDTGKLSSPTKLIVENRNYRLHKGY